MLGHGWFGAGFFGGGWFGPASSLVPEVILRNARRRLRFLFNAVQRRRVMCRMPLGQP